MYVRGVEYRASLAESLPTVMCKNLYLDCEVVIVMIIHEAVFVKLCVGIFWKAKQISAIETSRNRVNVFSFITVSFMRILRLREVARTTARIALEFAPEFVYVYLSVLLLCDGLCMLGLEKTILSHAVDMSRKRDCVERIPSAWDMVENPNPQSTPQFLLSFEENIPPVTYPNEVEEIIGIPIEVEPLDETPLDDLVLNTCNHDILLSSREVPSFDELEPQPKPLPNCSSLDISLGEERGPEPPIKPNSPDSFRKKVVDHLTIHTSPSPHVASFYHRDVY
ncbi:hypothetical protein Tco_0589965 [Tanacetum coccineum]